VKARRVSLQVASYGDGWKEAEDLFLLGFGPNGKTRNDGCAGVSGELHEARSSAGWDAEEIHKHAALE
jgi:hypothetical protein